MSNKPKRKLSETEDDAMTQRPASPVVNCSDASVGLSTESQVAEQPTLSEPCSSVVEQEQLSQSIRRPMSPLAPGVRTLDVTEPVLERPVSPRFGSPDASTMGQTTGFLSAQQSSFSDHGPSSSDGLYRLVPPLIPAVYGSEFKAHQNFKEDRAPPTFIFPAEPSTSISALCEPASQSLVRPSEPDWLPPSDNLSFPELADPDFEWDDSNINEEFYSLDEETPIYKGAPITLNESLVSILTMALHFSLSGRCIQALLNLIQLHCLKEDNIMKTSLFLFKKYFSHIRGVVDYEYYCSKCFSRCEKSSKCQKCVGEKHQLCCLIKIPMIPQLQTLLKRTGFFNRLDLNKKQSCSSSLADISDGKLYQDHIKGGFVGDGHTLSTTWYTDGAAIFKSSKLSAWPIYHPINELPYSQRFQKENLLISAIWCGPVQPHGNILLNAIYPDLVDLKNGVDMDIQGIGVKNIKVIVLNGTGDTPARSLMLNMVKHNGEFSCQKCEQKGECRDGFPGVRVFPYRPDEMKPRDDTSFERYGNIAKVTGSPYMGVKGNTLLSKITGSAVRGTGLDSMHLIYSGIGKSNVKFFVDSSFNKLPCNVGKPGRSLIDERLLSIKPPHYLTRVPKSLEEFAIWKTSLHKSMLCYFALPVLNDLVPSFHLKHFASLVAAVHFLNSDEVTEDDRKKADLLIQKYVSYFEDFYGRENMTISVHLLLHLVNAVLECGPLWNTACFDLEGVNGEILKLVHGTRHAEKQISSSLQMCLGLRDLVDHLKNGPCKLFCEDLLTGTSKAKPIAIGDISIIGEKSWRKMLSLPEFLREPLAVMGVEETDLYIFDCLEREKNLYVAESYNRSSARDSSCVQFSINSKSDIGIIKFFLRSAVCKCTQCSCDCKLYAVVEKLKIVDSFETLVPGLYVPNIHKYERSNNCLLLPITCLGKVCIRMEFQDKLFVAKRCNTKEIE